MRIQCGRIRRCLLGSDRVRRRRARIRPARFVGQQETHLSNLAVLGLPFMLMGGALGSIGLYFWREGSDLRSGGVDARAVIRKKFRKQGDPYMLGLENYFVAAEFLDAQQRDWTVEIRVPSRQWHWLREGATESIVYLPSNPARARVITRAGNTVVGVIELFAVSVGALFVLFGLFFLIVGLTGEGSASSAVTIPAPPPTKFDKTGFERTSMAISPQHDRVALLDEKGNSLRIRELASGQLLASAFGKGWRIIGWRPDGARIAVSEPGAPLILDASSLKPAPGETLSWIPGVLAPSLCPGGGPPVWNPAGTQAAIPCGNDVLLFPPNVRLKGHGNASDLQWSLSLP
ncbi:MAG TPA: DUF3592 domain-containing protein [Bryobacteraceae bacterium]